MRRRRKKSGERRVVGECARRPLSRAVYACSGCRTAWAASADQGWMDPGLCWMCGGRLRWQAVAPPGVSVLVPLLMRWSPRDGDGGRLTVSWRAFDVCELCEGEDGPEVGGQRVPMALGDDVLCVCASCAELLSREEGYQPVCVSAVAESPVPQSLDSPTR